MKQTKVLVTGATGFLGAWIVKDLAARGVPCVLFDRDTNLRRLEDLGAELPRGTAVEAGDIADADAVTSLVERHGTSAIIHLAALQMPFCRPNPIEGARVNVIGTLAVFEAARRLGSVDRIVYASSAAVIGPEERYGGRAVRNDDPLYPATHYGVFKQCNEGSAWVYFQDHGVSSVGLRPWTVYGLGRDQGVTADATRAIKAAFLGRPFKIRYGGRNALQYAGDVAGIFVRAALDGRPGCRCFNLRGQVIEMDGFVEEIERALPGAKRLIQAGGDPIPVACDLDDSELRDFLPSLPETSLREGIEETIAGFRRLEAAGRLRADDLA